MTDTWGRGLFISGAILVLLLGAVHVLSLVTKLVPANDTERQLFALMTNYKFDLMGSMRSMDNLFRGFSTMFVLCMLGMGSLSLIVSGERAALVKKAALANTLWLAGMTVVSLRYFFPAPTAFFVLALLLFLAAWLRLLRAAS